MHYGDEQDAKEGEQQQFDQAMHEKIMKMVEEVSGPIVAKLAESKARTYENVNHQDARNRFAALSLANMKWGVTQEIADICEELALNDSDAKVRGAAVICLNGYYRKTNHPRIARLLATIVYDQKESLDVRHAAYSGLFLLREPDPLKWRLAPTFKFPSDVDWSFVDACLHSPE